MVHQENKGVSAARNLRLSISKGKYIGFIDSGDTIENDMYEVLINNACIHQADISVCSMKCINPMNKQKFLGREEDLKLYNKEKALSSTKRKIQCKCK